MEYTYPDYFKKFVCIGTKCEDNCCMAGWQIGIDKESLEMYKKMEGPMGVRIRNSIDFENGIFEQAEHKCALLNEDNLCDIYCDAGPDKMCMLCQKYPRHYEEYENLREVSLSISCPEAARIVLSNTDKVGFYTEEDDEEEEYEDFDYLMHTKLQEIREYLFKVIQDRSLPVTYRMAIILTTTHDIQIRIKKNEIFEIDELLEKFEDKDFNAKAVKKFGKYIDHSTQARAALREMMASLHKLEVLKPEWTEFVNDCERTLYLESTVENYAKVSKEFDIYYDKFENEAEQLLMYFVFTYFCGAVYDDNALAKIKMSVYSVLMIHELDKARWVMQGKKFDFTDQVDIVHRYSKEVEHSDLNLNDSEEMVMKDKPFAMDKMLTAILGV